MADDNGRPPAPPGSPLEAAPRTCVLCGTVSPLAKGLHRYARAWSRLLVREVLVGLMFYTESPEGEGVPQPVCATCAHAIVVSHPVVARMTRRGS